MDAKSMKPLTRAELEVMSILWDGDGGMTVHEIVAGFEEPQPAYTTVATFLKILEAKGYVEHRRREMVGRTFCFYPQLSRQKYLTQVVGDVRDTLFGRSAKNLLHFLVEEEELSEADLQDILAMMNNGNLGK